MSTDELIEALQSATEGSRELDARIATLAHDLEARPYRKGGRKLWLYKRGTDGVMFYGEEFIPNYSVSIDAALTLVPEGFVWRCITDYGGFVRAAVSRHSGPFWLDTESEAATPALAICIAALKARGERS